MSIMIDLPPAMAQEVLRIALVAFAAMFVGGIAFADAPMLMPAPREMSITDGECHVKTPPKVEVDASIPPEGYELSITANGVTIRSSDDAGAFSARAAEHRRRLISEHVNCAPLK